jgi:ADP-ribosyl-[dinitrogen reductase] hydrolase
MRLRWVPSNPRNPRQIKGTGHVVRSLEAALWAFYHGSTFKDGCLLSVNPGDDADTTGAVYGQLARAFYGDGGIPESWQCELAHHDLVSSLAEMLLDLRRVV